MFIFRPVTRTVSATVAYNRAGANMNRFQADNLFSVESASLSYLANSGATVSNGVYTQFGGISSAAGPWVSTIRRFTQASGTDASDSVSLSSARGGVGAGKMSGFSYLFGGSNDTGNSWQPRIASSSAIQKHSFGSISTDAATLSSNISMQIVAEFSPSVLLMMGGQGVAAAQSYAIQRYDGSTRSTDSSSFTPAGAGYSNINQSSYAIAPMLSGLVWISNIVTSSGYLSSYDGTTITTNSPVQSGLGKGVTMNSKIYWTSLGPSVTMAFDGTTSSAVGSATAAIQGFSAMSNAQVMQ